MKPLFYISFFAFLILVSCTKEKTKNLEEIPSDLYGTWNWLYTTGGYAGINITPFTTGESKKIELTATGYYKYFVNDIIQSENKFHIEKSTSIYSHHDTVLMLVTGNGINQSFRFRTPDTLTLYEEAFDGFVHHYARLK
jgi:hypothetical protein